MAVDLAVLTRYLDELLEPERFADYAPNGLQVQGRSEVRRIVTAVSANQAAIDAAVAAEADVLLTHHGFFWRNEPRTIVGPHATRLAALLGHGLSLIAYHLPLDAHPVVGNNVGFLRALGAAPARPFAGEPPIGWLGDLPAAIDVDEALTRIATAAGAPPLAFAHGPGRVRRVAMVSGGGAGFFEEGVAGGADLFVTGEASEMAQALARELGATFVAAGHHRTERHGPRALGEHVAGRFAVEVTFHDVDNPV